MLTINALVAADSVLIPLQCEFLSLEGLVELHNTIDRVKQTWNKGLIIEGILFTMCVDRYKITGQIVARCISDGCELDTLPLTVYREYSDLFDEGVYQAIDLDRCVTRRTSEGGTSPESVRKQVAVIRSFIG